VRPTSEQPTERVTVAGRKVDAMTPPPGLDDQALAAWHQLRNDVASILDEADAGMLEAAAIALGRFRQARAIVNAGGLLVPNRFDELAPNPALKIEREAGAALHRAMVELGIGPSARARFSGLGVGVDEAAELAGVGDLVQIRGVAG
jgi:P27 family predicted phage terminase small subunit